jgi:uncharacterized protein YhaN
MKNVISKAITLCLASAFIFVSGISAATAQQKSCERPPKPKAKERMMQAKKIKMLDELKLDEKTADKLLVKYSALEKAIMAKKDAADMAKKELEKALEANAPKAEIVKKTSQYLDAISSMHKSLDDRNNEIKAILDEVQFAKYLIFEDNFMQDLQRIIFKMMKHGGKFDPRNGDKRAENRPMPPPDMDPEDMNMDEMPD